MQHEWGTCVFHTYILFKGVFFQSELHAVFELSFSISFLELRISFVEGDTNILELHFSYTTAL